MAGLRGFARGIFAYKSGGTRGLKFNWPTRTKASSLDFQEQSRHVAQHTSKVFSAPLFDKYPERHDHSRGKRKRFVSHKKRGHQKPRFP